MRALDDANTTAGLAMHVSVFFPATVGAGCK